MTCYRNTTEPKRVHASQVITTIENIDPECVTKKDLVGAVHSICEIIGLPKDNVHSIGNTSVYLHNGNHIMLTLNPTIPNADNYDPNCPTANITLNIFTLPAFSGYDVEDAQDALFAYLDNGCSVKSDQLNEVVVLHYDDMVDEEIVDRGMSIFPSPDIGT